MHAEVLRTGAISQSSNACLFELWKSAIGCVQQQKTEDTYASCGALHPQNRVSNPKGQRIC